MTKLDEANLYTTYYLNQAGSGYGGIYSGPVYQRGYGIGSFLGGLFRAVIPLLKKGSVILGKECFRAGLDVINDVENNNEEVATSLKRRGKELYTNVKKRAMNQMTGGQYNNNILKKSGYSSVAPRNIKKPVKRNNIKKKINKKNKNKKVIKKKSKVIDIFS